MDSAKQPDAVDHVAELVKEEMTRPPTEKERKRFEDFNGVPPHLRPGPRRAMYPTMSVSEIIRHRAMLAYLLVREFQLTVADARAVLGCEDESTVEKLVVAGNQVASAARFVLEIQQAFRKAAEGLLDNAPPPTTLERNARLVAPLQTQMRQLTAREIKVLRSALVYFLLKGFLLDKANVRAILGYPTGGKVLELMHMGERLISGSTNQRKEREIVLRAARAIINRS